MPVKKFRNQDEATNYFFYKAPVGQVAKLMGIPKYNKYKQPNVP